MFKLTLAAIMSAILIGIAPAFASDDDDRDKLYEAQSQGTILPLAEILKRLRPQIGDRIIEIEFEHDNDVAIYEIYYIDRKGRRMEIEVDAATAEILDMEEDD